MDISTEGLRPYETCRMVIGHRTPFTEPQEVVVVAIERSTFVAIVDEMIEEVARRGIALLPRTAAQLRETALTMPTFPFGRWVDANRGCGCLVGEYLIASEYLPRDELLRSGGAGWDRGDDPYWNRPTVDQLIRAHQDGEALSLIGTDVDTKLQDLLPEPRDSRDRPHAAVFVEAVEGAA